MCVRVATTADDDDADDDDDGDDADDHHDHNPTAVGCRSEVRFLGVDARPPLLYYYETEVRSSATKKAQPVGKDLSSRIVAMSQWASA